MAMKTLLKALAVIILAALGAGGVLYLDGKCPQKQAKFQEQLNEAIAGYIKNNPQPILESLAKSENFGNVIKSFSNVSDEEINDKIQTFLANNPSVLEDYIRNNTAFIAEKVTSSDTFKNAAYNSGAAGNNTAASNNESADMQDTAAAQDTAATNPDQKFLDHWEEMRNSAVAPYAGPKDAKVAVVEFFDFACGHCKALAPVMAQLIKNNPDVKFVFNPLFFMSEHSPYAAKAAIAAFEKGKFVEVYEGIMTLPEMNEETINQILRDEELDVDEIKKLSEEKKIRRGVQDIDALSQVLGINGVPMLLINGEPFYGRSLEDLQNKINSYK